MSRAARPLATYRRDFTPELEAAPREPVDAVDLVSAKGIPFTLVREASGVDHVGRMLAWLVWREDACVGYIATSVQGLPPSADPFDRTAAAAPPRTRRDFSPWRVVAIWRSLIVDETGLGTGAGVLARVPSRGLGIMNAAYADIVRQLSERGWVLRSNPHARSPDAKRLWKRLAATPGVQVVRSRVRAGSPHDYAFMLADALAGRDVR